jgi:hypothetical protein
MAMKAWRAMSSGRRCGSFMGWHGLLRQGDGNTQPVRRSAMVMRVMLIGLLIIGSVAMLETDVSAGCVPCVNFPCCYRFRQLKEAVEDAKKDESIQIKLIGSTASEREKVRGRMIQEGIRPERIGEVFIEDSALSRSMREGRIAFETQPK